MCLEGSIDKLKEYLKSVIEKAYEYRERDENDKEITLKDVLVSLENADKDHRSPHILYTTNPIISTLAIVFLSNKVKKGSCFDCCSTSEEDTRQEGYLSESDDDDYESHFDTPQNKIEEEILLEKTFPDTLMAVSKVENRRYYGNGY